ncbi:MAG: metal-binding protein [Chloroflexia bacterium]
MPPARVHDRITLITAGLLTPVVLALPAENRFLSWGLFTVAHLFSGLGFSCDLDVRAVEYRRWGPLRWLWLPYTQLVYHRSWLSHGLVIGPLLRLLYFGLIVEVLVLAGVYLFGAGPEWLSHWHAFWGHLVRDHPRYVLDFLAGFTTGGAVHTIPDWLTTGVKRLI